MIFGEEADYLCDIAYGDMGYNYDEHEEEEREEAIAELKKKKRKKKKDNRIEIIYK